MRFLNLVRLVGAVTAVSSVPVLLALGAYAQSTPGTDTAPPASIRPDVPPGAPEAPAARPPAGSQTPATAPGLPGAKPDAKAGKSAGTGTEGVTGSPSGSPSSNKTAADKPDGMIGLAVFGSDGQKVGLVEAVKAETDGRVMAIHVKTGGFLGFGGKVVAIPAGKFARSGPYVQLGLTADDVGKLPELAATAG